MTKENVLQGIIATTIAGISAYLQILTIPIIVLIAVMAIDYITGLINAKKTTEISSRIGIFGIVKKCCYIALVGVGATVDYIILQLGMDEGLKISFGLLITMWLIVNELISILENLSKIGVPMPGFLMKIVDKLKITVESKANSTTDNTTE